MVNRRLFILIVRDGVFQLVRHAAQHSKDGQHNECGQRQTTGPRQPYAFPSCDPHYPAPGHDDQTHCQKRDARGYTLDQPVDHDAAVRF